eukprot:411575_1
MGYKSYSSCLGYAVYSYKNKHIYLVGGMRYMSDGVLNASNILEVFDVELENITVDSKLVKSVCEAPTLIIENKLMTFGGDSNCNLTDAARTDILSIQVLDLSDSGNGGGNDGVWMM